MCQHKKHSCLFFLFSPTLNVSPPGGLLYSCVFPEHGLTIVGYTWTGITVKYRQTNSVLAEVPERHQRNHVISCATWMSLLQKKSPSRSSHLCLLLSRCVTACISTLLKTNLLISMHNLINAKESVWNSLIHSWLFRVSVISVAHAITAVGTLRLNLPNNSLALTGQDPAPFSPSSPLPLPSALPPALPFPSNAHLMLRRSCAEPIQLTNPAKSYPLSLLGYFSANVVHRISSTLGPMNARSGTRRRGLCSQHWGELQQGQRLDSLFWVRKPLDWVKLQVWFPPVLINNPAVLSRTRTK